MDAQREVAAFVTANDLSAPPAYRALDLVSEVGELSKAVCESTDYGTAPDDVAVPEDELGDALFSLLALAEGLDVDAEAALGSALAKYERRIGETGSPDSGN